MPVWTLRTLFSGLPSILDCLIVIRLHNLFDYFHMDLVGLTYHHALV
jgi:hypothetical protein